METESARDHLTLDEVVRLAESTLELAEDGIDPSTAVRSLAQAHTWLVWIHEGLDGLDLSDPRSPRVYVEESTRTEADEGTYPVSVVLAYLPTGNRPWATWLRVHRPEEKVTADGSYLDTAEEAVMEYERRCGRLGLEPYPDGWHTPAGGGDE